MSLDELLAWCAQQNAQPLYRAMERWFFVTENDEGGYKTSYVDGLRAIRARSAAEGRLYEPWDPEPGEVEWIGRAIAEYLKHHPAGTPQHFRQTMAKWSASKPWRKQENAA
jgi:hypothetical protein